jgi:hypothetical protein
MEINKSSAAEALYFASYVRLLAIATMIWVLWLQWSSYRRLSKVKGPFWAQITNLWMFCVMAEKKKGMRLLKASETYGAPFRPPRSIEADPLQEIL